MAPEQGWEGGTSWWWEPSVPLQMGPSSGLLEGPQNMAASFPPGKRFKRGQSRSHNVMMSPRTHHQHFYSILLVTLASLTTLGHEYWEGDH